MSWNRGIQCKVLSMISSMSLEMSLSILCLMSVFLLQAITGKGTERSTASAKNITCILLWILFGLLCSVGFTGLVGIKSSACVLFNFGNFVFSGWQYQICLFLCVNCLLLILTSISCVKSVLIIHNSEKKVRKLGQVFGKTKYGSAYRNIVLLFASSLLTWIPFDILMVVSLCGMTISPEVTYWFVIFVLPVNSLSNPFLYTIRNVMSKKMKKHSSHDKILEKRKTKDVQESNHEKQ